MKKELIIFLNGIEESMVVDELIIEGDNKGNRVISSPSNNLTIFIPNNNIVNKVDLVNMTQFDIQGGYIRIKYIE